MATLPAKHTVRALTFGLGLAGALLVGPALETPAALAGPVGIVAADDPNQPTVPDPAPGALGPVDPNSPQGAPRPHRRHVDNDPVFRR